MMIVRVWRYARPFTFHNFMRAFVRGLSKISEFCIDEHVRREEVWIVNQIQAASELLTNEALHSICYFFTENSITVSTILVTNSKRQTRLRQPSMINYLSGFHSHPWVCDQLKGYLMRSATNMASANRSRNETVHREFAFHGSKSTLSYLHKKSS